MKRNYEKIPIPASQKWKEIRVRLFPLLIFVVVGFVVALLWRDRIDATNMIGQVVGKQAEVRSPQSGSLAEIIVRDFDEVAAGDPLGRLITTDPKIIEAELAVVLAEIEMIRLSMDPFAAQQRNLLNYESMQMDLMENRARLGVARIRKQQAEREFNRINRLYLDGLSTEEAKDRSETEFLSLEEEVKVIEELVDRMESRLEDIDMDEILALWQEEDPRAVAINVQQKSIDRIKAELMPVELRAPVGGQIVKVHKVSGEYVDQGEIIMQINSPQPDYIVAHLRHPVFIKPEPGMEVLVRKQHRGRDEAIMEIAEVGVQLESIEQMATLFQDQTFETVGLPLKVAINHELDLMPGEIVDIRLIIR